MATIFHLAMASDWAAARSSGVYTISTRGRTLAEEGFIHASRGDQWPGVRERFYADVTEPMVLLQIDTDLLGVPVVEEPAVPGAAETFPHIYGPLPVAAVVKAIPLDSPSGTPAPKSSATPAAAPTAPDRPAPTTPSPAGSFAQTYFREMFFNAGLIVLVLVLGAIGIVIGKAVSTDASGVPGLTGLAGVVVGIALAAWIYRRHK